MIILKFLLSPLAFALGFLTPLIAQVLDALALDIYGVPNLIIGLSIAMVLGFSAQVRGGWLWHSSKTQ